MAKRVIKWVITLILLLVATMIFFLFRPILYKKNRIETLTNIELPESAKIIDYKYDISLFYGVELYYAKVGIDQNTYNAVNGPVFTEIDDSTKFMHNILYHDDNKPNFKNVEEFKCCDLLGSSYTLLLSGSTRVTHYVLTKETSVSFLLFNPESSECLDNSGFFICFM